MKQNNNKKGFTIVELVIVIAVIAILAAVLIPTFVSITRKANQSADIQAVRQMNTLLAIGDAEGGYDDIADVIFALDQEKIDLEDYKPLSKDTYFYWVKSENRIVYTDAQDTVIFPKELEGLTPGDWYSLSGDVPVDANWTVSDGTLSVGSAAQLVDFINKYNEKNDEATDVTTITLTADLDFRGSAANFKTIATDITFNGGSKTIKNVRVDANTVTGIKSNTSSDASYYYGFFGHIPTGKTVTVENVTFEGVSVGDTKFANTSYLGVVAGYAQGTLNVTNVTINNAYVFGASKIGAVVGGSDKAVKLENVDVTATRVEGAWNVAKVSGYVSGTFTMDENCSFEGITSSYSKEIADKVAAETYYTVDNVVYRDVDSADTITRDGYTWINRPTKVLNDKVDPMVKLADRDKAYYPASTDKNLWVKDADKAETTNKVYYADFTAANSK